MTTRPLAALVLAASLVIAACGDDDGGSATLPTHPLADREQGEADQATAGYIRDPAPQVGDLSLPDLTADEDFEFVAQPDGLLLVFFGFTHCPDVCPDTMANVRFALGKLSDEADEADVIDVDRIDVAMVTVDPDRDLDVLADYVQSFVPDGHALGTDDPAELRVVADAFGASYLVEESQSGEIEVGHTDQIYGIDDTGSMVMTWPFPVSSDDLVADILYLAEQRA